MKSNGKSKYKASYTVEAALVMPLIFGVLLAVLFFILMLYQKTVLQTTVNRDSLRASNAVTNEGRDPNGYVNIASFNKRIWTYYFEASDYFASNNVASVYSGHTDRASSTFNIFRNYTGASAIVERVENASVKIENNSAASVSIPFFGRLTGDFKSASYSPEINPSKYIRNVDDSNKILTYILETMSNPIIQAVWSFIEMVQSAGA